MSERVLWISADGLRRVVAVEWGAQPQVLQATQCLAHEAYWYGADGDLISDVFEECVQAQADLLREIRERLDEIRARLESQRLPVVPDAPGTT